MNFKLIFNILSLQQTDNFIMGLKSLPGSRDQQVLNPKVGQFFLKRARAPDSLIMKPSSGELLRRELISVSLPFTLSFVSFALLIFSPLPIFLIIYLSLSLFLLLFPLFSSISFSLSFLCIYLIIYLFIFYLAAFPPQRVQALSHPAPQPSSPGEGSFVLLMLTLVTLTIRERSQAVQ